MNINELREKILSFTGMDEPYKSKSIKNAFSEYECQQSNKSDEEPEIKETGFEGRLNANALKNMKKENEKTLIAWSKESDRIDECKAEIETLKKQVKAIDKFYVSHQEPDLPKQERFIFQSYDGSGKFHIYDNKQEYFHDGLFSRHQAEETCRILNLMEASK